MTTTNSPNPLGNVKGQEKSVEFLQKIHSTQRYPNAFLFHGAPGVGKKYCALQYAKYINLTCAPDRDRSLLELVDRDEHPDIRVFSKPDDSNSFKIDIVREVLEESRRPKVRSLKKVIVLEEIQNFPSYRQSDALLKTVEDGFPNVIFIFTTTDFHGVFSTLKSRTTPLRFAPLDSEVLFSILEKKFGSNPELELACKLAEGSLDKAIRFMDPPEESLSGSELRTRSLKLLRSIGRAYTHSILAFVRAIPDEDLIPFAEVLTCLVGDLLLVEEGLDFKVINQDLLSQLNDLSSNLEGKGIKLFKPLREFNSLKTRNGLNIGHQLKNTILKMRDEVLSV